MEVLHPNPVSFSGSYSMASSFPASNAQNVPQATLNNNYAPFLNNNTQANFHFPATQSTAIPTSYGVFPSPNPTNIYFVNTSPQNNNVFFANNVSWNFPATDGPRGIKRKSYDVDPGVPSISHQKKTRSWYDYPDSDLHELNNDHTSSLPTTSDDSSKQIILYQGSSSTNSSNNSNTNFLKTLFESNPINFFARDHIIDPETKKALIPVNPTILSLWDTPDDSEPERELIKSPRIVELTEDDLDTGEEHIKQIPTIIDADVKPTWDSSPVPSVDSNDTPTVLFPITPPTSPPRPRTYTPYDEEDEDEELIVDEDNNVVRIKPKSEVVIEEIHDEPSPAEPEPYQGMDIE